MNGFDASDTDRSPTPTVHWAVYQVEGCVHAVADVPRKFSTEAIGFGATDTTATVFVGPSDSSGWTVDLPEPVNPLPESISYNNGVVEVTFSHADWDQGKRAADSPCETA